MIRSAYRNGRPYVSAPLTWVASTPHDVNLGFLNPAVGHFHRPVVDEIWLQMAYNITTGAGGGFGADDQLRVFARTVLKDALGDRIDLIGVNLRSVMYYLLGDGHEDPPAIASSQSGATGNIWARIPFRHPYKLRNPEDPGIPVAELLSKGEFTVHTSPAVVETNTTINSGTIRAHALVREQVAPEARSRIKWIDRAINSLEQEYTVNGQLLAAWALARQTADAGYNTWASMTTISAEDLGYSNTIVDFLRQVYRSRSRGIFATDQLESGVAFVVYAGKEGQSLADLPNIKTMTLTFAGTTVPANSRLVLGILTDRDPEAVAHMIGAESGQGAKRLLEGQGRIAGGKGEAYSRADALLRARLPVTAQAGTIAARV